MQQMGDTIKKVNDTFDEMKADIESTVAAIGDTVDNANALIVDVSDRREEDDGGWREDRGRGRADRRGHPRREEWHHRQAGDDDELYTRITGIFKTG